MAGCGVVVGEVTLTSSSARSGSGCDVTSLCSRAGEIAGGDGSIDIGAAVMAAWAGNGLQVYKRGERRKKTEDMGRPEKWIKLCVGLFRILGLIVTSTRLDF